MRDFRTIIEELKHYIAAGKEKKVLDKDVAALLEIDQSKFATIKKRNVTPYVNILEFCKREDVCCKDIFFD